MVRSSIFAILLAASLALSQTDRFPAVQGENLLNQKITLPEAASGHAAVIVIGFSHSSNREVKAWSDRLQHDLPVYSIAVLEEAPRLVRGMAVHGMKSGVPQDQRGHFIVVYRDERELKAVAGVDAPNDAYVLLLDKDGAIRWRTHGAVTDAAVEELKSHAAPLAPDHG